MSEKLKKSPPVRNPVFTNDVLPLPIDIGLFTTSDGTVYQNVKVVRVEPDGITIRHSTGLEKIHARNLSDEDRSRFHLTPEAARAYLEQQRQAKEQERQAKEQAAQIAALYAKADTYSLHCIRSDKRGVLCRDFGTVISDRFGTRMSHSGYTMYFIRNHSVMPDTDFNIYAAPNGHIKLDDTSSAIELIPLQKTLKPKR